MPGLVIAEDQQEYLLASAFAIRRREPEQVDMDLDVLEERISHIEEMLIRRATHH